MLRNFAGFSLTCKGAITKGKSQSSTKSRTERPFTAIVKLRNLENVVATKFTHNLPLILAAFLLMPLVGCNTLKQGKSYRSLEKAAEAGKPGVRSIPINVAQGAAYVDDNAYKELSSVNSRVVVNLSEQRAKVYAGDRVVIDTPVSTGVSSHPTPRGSYTILDKKQYHRSGLYGSYVDEKGTVVLRNVDSRKTAAPAGTSWRGTMMPYWQRLTWDGVGMHVGHVPGAPASHGCLRFPSKVMPLVYARTKVGTPVIIE